MSRRGEGFAYWRWASLYPRMSSKLTSERLQRLWRAIQDSARARARILREEERKLVEHRTPKIPKSELVDGAYYQGRCRNARVARWRVSTQKFYHWREKFGQRFVETIHAPEDDEVYDVFVAEERVDFPLNPNNLIPFED